MNNENLIPDEIMDLVHHKAFTNLSAEEKTLVETFVTAREYDELYQAAQMTTQYFKDAIAPSFRVKKNLDEAFQQKHRNKKSILLAPIELWKVAAVFLLFLGASLWYLKQNIAPDQPNNLLAHDTVFVEKKNDIIQHIIDTVIEYKYIQDASKEKAKSRIKNVVADNNHGQDTADIQPLKSEDIGIRTLQAEDLYKDLPNNNGKSMQEDELVKRFGFAKI